MRRTSTWKPGREATSHTAYIGLDSNAVADGQVSGESVDDPGYTPASLDFATTYFWKVDETGDTGAYAGDVWSFTTEEFAAIDDFESYNDDVDAETTIWHAWIDGVTDQASGSQVGYDESPFAEKTILHGGKQSMPMTYDNSGSPYYSQAERTFDSPQDWTAHGGDALRLYFRGVATSFAETAYGGVLMNASARTSGADPMRSALPTRASAATAPGGSRRQPLQQQHLGQRRA